MVSEPAKLSRADATTRLAAPGQPYELEDVVVNGRTLRWFKHSPSSLRQLFSDTATDKPFLVYENERLTYAEAWQEASKIAHVMVYSYGVGKGDRVAISMRNYPEWIIAYTAITSIGAIAVAMNAMWQSDEMAYGLKDSGAKLLFADQERLDRLEHCAPVAGLSVIAVRPTQSKPGVPVWAALLRDLETTQQLPVSMPVAAIALDDPANMLYTSGSTGNPKGVVSTHRNVLAALLSWELDRNAAELVSGVTPPAPAFQPGTLLAVPLFHVTGLNAVYLCSYRLQRRIVSMYKWNPELAAALVEREKLTSFVAPAAMTGDLVRTAANTKHDLSSLLAVGGGGAPRAPEQVRQIDQAFANALPNTGWGMTETSAIGAGIGGEEYLLRPASSGRCSAVLAFRIQGDNGKALAANQRGELLVRGTSVFTGYWNRPQANAQVFTEGWFHTGDVAYLDDEGYLFIVDRIKEVIIRGGENIGCGKVESILLMHPLVHEAAVYGVPDERLGEEVGATVYADDLLNLDELRAFLITHLARFEVPRYMTHAAVALPRTPSGKILKRQIRADALKQLPL